MAITPTIIDKQYQQIWGFDPRTIPTCNLWIDASTGSSTDLSIYGNKIVETGTVTYSSSPNGLKYINVSSSNYLTTNSASSTINSNSFGITAMSLIHDNTINPAVNSVYISPDRLTGLLGNTTVNLSGTSNWKDSSGVFPRYTLKTIPTTLTSLLATTLIVHPDPYNTITIPPSKSLPFTNLDNITFSLSSTTSTTVTLNSVSIGPGTTTYNLVTPAAITYVKSLYIDISGYTDANNNGTFQIVDLVPNYITLTITSFTTDQSNACIFTYTGTAPTANTQLTLNDDFGSIPSNNNAVANIYYYNYSSTNQFYLTDVNGSIINTGSTLLPPVRTATYIDATKTSGIVVSTFFQSVNVQRALSNSIINVSIFNTVARYTFNSNPVLYGYAVNDSVNFAGLTGSSNTKTNVSITNINTSYYPPYYIEITKATGNTGQISTTQIPITYISISGNTVYRVGVLCISASATSTKITYIFSVNIKLYGYEVGQTITMYGFNPSAYNISGVITNIASDGKSFTFTKSMTPGSATTLGNLNYDLSVISTSYILTVTGSLYQNNNVTNQLITAITTGSSTKYSSITVASVGTIDTTVNYTANIASSTLNPDNGTIDIVVDLITNFTVGNSVLIQAGNTDSGVYKIIAINGNTLSVYTNETVAITSGTVITQCIASASSHGIGGVSVATTDTGSAVDTGINKSVSYTFLANTDSKTFQISADGGSTVYPLLAQTFSTLVDTTSNTIIADSNVIAKTTRINSNYVYLDNIDWIQRGSTSIYFDIGSTGATTRDTKYFIITVNSTKDSTYNDYGIQIDTVLNDSIPLSLTDNPTYISNVYFAEILGVMTSFTTTSAIKYCYPTGSVGMVQTDKNTVTVNTSTDIDTSLSKMVTVSGVGSYSSTTIIHIRSSGYNGTYKLLSGGVIPNTFDISSNLNGVPIYPTTTMVQSSKSVSTATISGTILTVTLSPGNTTNYFVPGSIVYLSHSTQGGYYIVTDITSTTQFKVQVSTATLFTPTSVTLQVPYVRIGLDITTNDFAIFAVVQIPALPISGTNTYYIISKNSSSTPRWEFYATASTSTTFWVSYNNGTAYLASAATSLTGWVVVSAIANRSLTNGLQVFINGTGGTTASGDNPSKTLEIDGNTYIGISSHTTPQYLWTSGIGEILMYNTTINSTMQQTIEGYLAWKWGLQNSLDATHPYFGSKSLPVGINPTCPFARLLAPTDILNCKIWLDGQDRQSIYTSPKNIATIVSNGLTMTITIASSTGIPSGFGVKNTIMVTDTTTSADGYVFTVVSIATDRLTITAASTSSFILVSNTGSITFNYGEFPLSTSVYAWNDKSMNGNTAWKYSTALLPLYTGSGVAFSLASRTTTNLQKLTNSAVLQTKFSSGNTYETGFIVFNVDHYSSLNNLTYPGSSLNLGENTYLLGSTTNSPFVKPAQSRAVVLHQHNSNALADEVAFGIIVEEGAVGKTYVASLNAQGPCSDLLRTNKTYILCYTTVYTNDYTFCEYLNGLGMPLVIGSVTFAGGSTANTLLGPQYQGKILEYIAYTSTTSTIISNTDRQRVEGYLAKKWGVTLTSGHPFATIPPDKSVPY